MPEFICPVVKLEGFTKHPNADSLSLVTVEGCPCIVRTADWKEGDYAIYVPIEAVVPETVPGTEFLGSHRRIRATRLRGIFSMGLLLPAAILSNGAPWKLGEDVTERLGIKKYEEPVKGVSQPGGGSLGPTRKIVDPKLGPIYDLENYRKYGKKVFEDDEPVVVTEKIHGTNFRFGHKLDTGLWAKVKSLFTGKLGTKFYVGSHKTWRLQDDRSAYWQVAQKFDLAAKTKGWAEYCFYGEIYGKGVQDLTYDAADGDLQLAIFDIWDEANKVWLDYGSIKNVCRQIKLSLVPVIWDGPLNRAVIEPLCNGKSTLAPKQIREGIVIRKKYDTISPYGRPVLKLVGEDYLLRKNGTEHH